ncbi:MAG TPA: 50S ribosomal protein L25 [Candidatus Pacearchaeota archaeon]|nr:50S ribosomal protein L25 [Candidatus Pacearchaeota archaeon]HOL90488.1 50S ribosomal protein L25 [Candidatus Pacearchaeota archaeon]HPO68459.1 50S ribosomal protein L25 [Candidatus Pacearchaeota archaeon]
MITIKAKKREKTGKEIKKLREKGILPSVLYGPKIKPQPIELDLKEFKKIYKEAGESSLISLEIENKKTPVLIHKIEKDPVTDEFIHVDFYQPILTEEVEAVVPLVFEGISPAVKDLGGTLIKEIHEVHVKALPENLPHEIKVNIENLKTFEDEILVKDLILPQKVKVLREPDEIVALVVPPEKIEEELQKPIEEKVEEVEKVEKERKKEAEESTIE